MTSYQYFNDVIKPAETEWIKKRRQKIQTIENDSEQLNGLAMSGGGIRSASVNLGVLQALEKHQQLNKIDVMSSVSGGGYIASSLTWFKSKLKNVFPFGTCRQDNQKLPGSIMNWIRYHGNFLAPGNGINKASLITAILTGNLINLFILLPIFILLIYCALIPFSGSEKTINEGDFTHSFNTFTLMLYGGYALAFLCFGLMLVSALSTGISSFNSQVTEKLRKTVSKTFSSAMFFLFIGAIPIIHQLFEQFTDYVVHASISVSFIGTTAAWYSSKQANKISTSIVVNIGLLCCCLGFLLVVYHNALAWHQSNTLIINEVYFSLIALSFGLALLCNINLVSMHGYYRNRLRDAFMPYELPATETFEQTKIATWGKAQACYVKDIPITDAPYHIINCNVELTSSKHPKYSNRAGDSFIISPLFCGATSTGYQATSQYHEGKVDLATATAISGAAVATNTSKTRSKTLNFVLGILNLRLGCWFPNPKFNNSKAFIFKPLWYFYMFHDTFGKGLDENQKYVHLSDGGHFENLGVYELIRRKCSTILSIDAAADKNFNFESLAKMIELVRVDFGAKISIDIDELLPNENGISKTPYAIGKIAYNDNSQGKFIFLKTAMINELNADIYSYQKLNPDFPSQSTIDQFFNESQFEAYRELGFQLTHKLLKEHPDLFSSISSNKEQ